MTYKHQFSSIPSNVKFVERIMSQRYGNTGYNYPYIRSIGIKPTANSRISAKFLFESTPWNWPTVFCSAPEDSPLHAIAVRAPNVNQQFQAWFGGQTITSPVTLESGKQYVVSIDRHTLCINGISTAVSGEPSFDKNAVRDFEINQQSNRFERGIVNGYWYWFKVEDGGDMLADYRAAIDPDGIACFYDMISGKYKYSTSGYQFTYDIRS